MPTLRTGAINPHSASFRQINDSRGERLKNHISEGGEIEVELGCGDGGLARSLSMFGEQWVVGVDRLDFNVQVGNDEASVSNFLDAEKYYYLRADYKDVLGQWDERFKYLSGCATKTFMIMPLPARNFIDEMILWLRMRSEAGSLHLRTEKMKVYDKVLTAIRPQGHHVRIPFDRKVSDLSSTFTYLHRNITIYEYGITLRG
ncbi:MAG: hypothetical protein HQ564_06080 [Candidatus Saganbacteria bacterium]|nr:hypothetical protein [Candidatus Saganbacteria bacterium]